MSKTMTIVIGMISVIFVFSAMPLITIWSLNILFDLEIPTTINTWAASLALIIILNSSARL